MPDVIVRNIPEEDAEWLKNAIPPGMSREAFLRDLIAQERSRSVRDSAGEAQPEKDGEFRFIDLFAGIGGFYMAATAIGGACAYTNEWDKHAAATYKVWTGSTHVDTRDIRTVDFASEIPDHELLVAGFPCQPFSIAGVSKKNSLGRKHGFDDERQGNLFFSICAIASEKRPRVMLLENVKNLKSHDKGNTWKVILESLESLDYEVRHQVVDAKSWVPQHRERIFLACFDRQKFSSDQIAGFEFPVPPKRAPRLGSILERDVPSERYRLTPNLWKYLQDYAAKHRAKGNGFGFQLVGPNDTARTMSARYYKDGSEILIDQPGWDIPRRLTPAEAARLMGFGSRYSRMLGHGRAFPQVVSDTQAYKQFGNSVCPLVVEAILERLKPFLGENSTR